MKRIKHIQPILTSTVTALAFSMGSSVALAQSNVTIAGRIDMGLQHINTGRTSDTRMDSGTYTASRLIFRGTEDLGGGLSVLFYLESRFNASTGEQQSAAKFWNAGSYLGLSSKDWGTITLGRQYVPMFWSFLFADDTGPHRLHSYSAVQSVQRSNFARIRASASPITTAGSLDVNTDGIYSIGISSAFEDNMIVYKTPSIQGFTAMLGYKAADKYAGHSDKLLSGNIEYRKGPLYASIAATQKRGTVLVGGASARQKLSEQLVSSMYEIAPGIKLWGNFHPWQMQSVENSKLKGRDWMLGASYWFQHSQLWINYANKRINHCASCNSSGWGIGYHYSLSKRTELYVSHARVHNSANSANALRGFAPDDFGHSVRATTVGIATAF